MSELPKGWVETNFEEVSDYIQRGKGPKYTEYSEYPVVNQKAVRWFGLQEEHLKYVHPEQWDKWDEQRYVCLGDILWNSTGTGTIGRACHIDEIQLAKAKVVDSHVTIVRTNKFVDSKFAFYWIKHPEIQNNINGLYNGSTNQVELSKKIVQSTRFPLAPLAEQKRIVEKLDEVLAQVDTIKARLDGIPDLLKRFRQSVLASAVSGKLTEEWRDRSNCLAEIDLQHELLKNTTKPRNVEQTSNHELVVDKFPSNWEKSTFTELYKFIDYRGKTPKKSEHGYRLYTAKNIKMGFVSNEPIEYLSESDYEAWMTRGFSRLGDIFFVTEGHTMGCTAINELGSEIALAQRTLTLQPYGNVNTKFHKYYMMSDSFQKLVDLNATGSAAKGIKAAKFRGLPLPFPSYAEQKEIVRLVDQYFAFADTIEAQVKKAQARVDNLTQSILAKAFRGELVAQDPSDEPADKLLERIAKARAEADALAKAAKKAAKSSRKATVKQ